MIVVCHTEGHTRPSRAMQNGKSFHFWFCLSHSGVIIVAPSRGDDGVMECALISGGLTLSDACRMFLQV